jgi:hypothetical protein
MVAGTAAAGLMLTVLYPPAAAAATPARGPVVPASSTDGSGGSDDSCGTANPCGAAWIPRPGFTASNVPAASRRSTSEQDESSVSGLVGWLLDLLGLTGHHDARSNSGTVAIDPRDSGSGPVGHPLTGRSPRVANTSVAAGVAGPGGDQVSRSAHQPVTSLTAPPQPASLLSPVTPAHRPLDQPVTIASGPPRPDLPYDPGPATTGRSKPELADQWASARQAARGSPDATGTAPSATGGRAATGPPTPPAAGMGRLLSAAVAMTSTAVTAVAGPTAGRQTHDLLNGVLRQVESALTTGSGTGPDARTGGPGPATARDRADEGSHAQETGAQDTGGQDTDGQAPRSDDTHSPNPPR